MQKSRNTVKRARAADLSFMPNAPLAVFINVIFLFLWAVYGSPAQAKEACSLQSEARQLTGLVLLDPDCEYDETFVISQSQTTLDCRGATIDLQYQRDFGIQIKADAGKVITDISVKNCVILNADSAGIVIDNGVNVAGLSESQQVNGDAVRAFSPKNIVIDNVNIGAAKNAGIYIRKYITGVMVSNSTIKDSYGVCIYIDAYSKYNQIIGNVFEDCGFRNRTSGKVNKNPSSFREGLAIDSASSNLIKDNVFDGNAAGGIFLYKNCSEHNAQTGVRVEPAAHNEIVGNTFMNMPVGVWVASRQSRNLSKSDCWDKSPYTGALKNRYFLDHAPSNTITDNRFANLTEVGVRIEDDFTTIRNNSFTNMPAPTEVGAQFRANLLNLPVTGTVDIGNTFR